MPCLVALFAGFYAAAPWHSDDRCTLIAGALACLSANSTRSYRRRLDAISRTERLWRLSLYGPSRALRPAKEPSLENGVAAGTLLTGLHRGPHLCHRIRGQESAHDLPRPRQREGAMGGGGPPRGGGMFPGRQRPPPLHLQSQMEPMFTCSLATSDCCPTDLMATGVGVCRWVLSTIQTATAPRQSSPMESWRSSAIRTEEHTSELQSPCNLVCRLLLDKNEQNRKRWTGRSFPRPRPVQLAAPRGQHLRGEPPRNGWAVRSFPRQRHVKLAFFCEEDGDPEARPSSPPGPPLR